MHLIFKQKMPEIIIFEKNFNMCMIGRIQKGNVFMKEFFRQLLDNIDFVVKCPFKKGVYKRAASAIYNINSTGLSIPSFITNDKEFMLIQTFSTRVNGKIEEILVIEFTYKFYF